MPLTIGSRIGPYEITSPLGAGGMGVVYKARDTRLGRDVAIKVLPDAFATDPDRLARFAREAQVLASLNHPNIAHIYGLEESAATRCIVMELVEGETLAARLAGRGPADGRGGSLDPPGGLPIDEALGLAKQIVDALEAAHEKGVVHRDLKPGNVMVMPGGTVKVLDFGLAKALEPASNGAGAGATHSPTLSFAATQAGVILGTAAYMSPEQAKGVPADARSDVFSFGCVLYELLTGRQPFTGETVSEVIASVLVRDPDFTRLPPNLNPKVHDLIRRCLDKNPRRRWQAVGDIRIELEAVTSGVQEKPETTAVAPPRASRLPWAAAGVASALAILTAAAAYFYVAASARPDTSIVRFELDTPIAGTSLNVSVSPDGKRVAGIAQPKNSAVWIRSLDQLDFQLLQGTDLAQNALFWSPDGRFIGFASGGKLKRVDVFGAPPQILCDAGSNFAGGTWNRNDVIVFSNGSGPLLRVPAAGGPPQPVTELDTSRQETAHLRPQFLPDGEHFIFLAISSRPEQTGIYVGSLGSKDKPRILATDSMTVFAPPRRLLFVRQQTLMTQEIDLDRFTVIGDPSPLAEGVARLAEGFSSFAVSENGVLAYRGNLGLQLGMNRVLLVDRTGRGSAMLDAPADYRNIALSADAGKMAFNRAEESNDLWILDVNRRTTTRFTFDAAVDDHPLWSPDGLRIVFSSTREGGVRNLWEKPSGGAGREQLLLKTGRPKTPTDWSRDGRFILYEEQDSKTGADLWVLPITGDKKPTEYLRTQFNETQARFSPDGRWVTYTSDESGQDEVYVQSFPPAGGKWQVSTEGGFQPSWRGDGKELVYLSPVDDNQFMTVSVRTRASEAEFTNDVPQKLFVHNVRTGAPGRGTQRNSYDIARDGRRFVLNSTTLNDASNAAAASRVNVVLNWDAVLKR